MEAMTTRRSKAITGIMTSIASGVTYRGTYRGYSYRIDRQLYLSVYRSKQLVCLMHPRSRQYWNGCAPEMVPTFLNYAFWLLEHPMLLRRRLVRGRCLAVRVDQLERLWKPKPVGAAVPKT